MESVSEETSLKPEYFAICWACELFERVFLKAHQKPRIVIGGNVWLKMIGPLPISVVADPAQSSF